MDEPTVGVDPIIRQSIWDHLVEITNTMKKTVIITTHYIEETRQAHVVRIIHNLFICACLSEMLKNLTVTMSLL